MALIPSGSRRVHYRYPLRYYVFIAIYLSSKALLSDNSAIPLRINFAYFFSDLTPGD